MPVILTIWMLRLGGLWFEASLGKQFMRPKQNGLEVWLKQ
jgi:hypothetical protein